MVNLIEKKCTLEKRVAPHDLTTAQKKKARWIALNQRYAAAFRAAGYDSLAAKLEDCHTTNQLAICSHCGHHWYVINRCRQRVCAVCSWQVATERQRYILALTRNMQHPKMITLTTPPVTSDPKDGIRRLREAWHKLRKHPIMSAVRGGAYTIEVVVREDYYHIHMHVIIDAPYIPYKALFGAWREIIKCRAPQVDIRACSTATARKYIAKDAAKNHVMHTTDEQIVKWYEATHGLRLWATFGDWYNATLEDIDGMMLPDIFAPACPSCGSLHTTFLARDGPHVVGPATWEDCYLPLLRDVPFALPCPAWGYLHADQQYLASLVRG